MAKEKTILEMAKEMGLNEKRIADGLKSHEKEVSASVKAAYAFKMKRRK